MKANRIYLAFVFLLVLFSCKNNNQNSTDTESQSIVENNEIENHSQTEENHSISSKKHKESDRFKIIIGDSYEYKYGDNHSLPATHVYLQMDNFSEVELPTMIGGVSLDLFPEMKEDFEKENTPRKNENIVFEFYTEFADAGDIYIGVFVDHEIQIYKKSTAEEENVNAEFYLSQIYEVTEHGLQHFYQRGEDGDYNTYDFSRWQQDFFQPITYSLEQIHQYIAESFDFDTAKNKNAKEGRITDRFSMFLDYMDAMEMEAPTSEKYHKIFEKVYDVEAFPSPTDINFSCGYDLSNYETTGTLTNEKLEKYVYTADLTVNNIVKEGNEKGTYFCKKRIQIVQINGLLFFDLIYTLEIGN